MIAENKLLEWAEVYGNYYGTPVEKVREVLESGRDMLLEIDTKGAMNVQKIFLKEATFIFLIPPSLAELERRIRAAARTAKKPSYAASMKPSAKSRAATTMIM